MIVCHCAVVSSGDVADALDAGLRRCGVSPGDVTDVIDAFGSEGRLVVDSPIETEISNAVREGVLHNVRRA